MKDFNKNATKATGEMIQKDPDKGIFPITASLDMISGVESRVSVREKDHFPVFTLDEDPGMGGEDHGPNPIEYLMTGLIGCVSISSSIMIRNAGIKLDALHAELASKIDMGPMFGVGLGGQHGVYDIRIKLYIKADAPQDKLEALVQQGLQQSPAYNSMKNPVRVLVIKE